MNLEIYKQFTFQKQDLDSIKLKAYLDDKIHVAQTMISVFHRVENIFRKGKHAVYQHFFLSLSVFLTLYQITNL